MKEETLSLSWDDVEKACINIGHKISISGFKPDFILPVLWGGVIPARILIDIMDWDRSICIPIFARSYINCDLDKDIKIQIDIPQKDPSKKDILIVEEIVDSGRTTKNIKEHLLQLGYAPNNVKIASVARRNHRYLDFRKENDEKPDFFHITVNEEWVIYPWDRQEYMRVMRKE